MPDFILSPLPGTCSTYHYNAPVLTRSTKPENQKESLLCVKQLAKDINRDLSVCLPEEPQNFIEIKVGGVSKPVLLHGKDKEIILPRENAEERLDLANNIASHIVYNGAPLSTAQLLHIGASQGLLFESYQILANSLQCQGRAMGLIGSGAIKNMQFFKNEDHSLQTAKCTFHTTQLYYLMTSTQKDEYGCSIQGEEIFYKEVGKQEIQSISNADPLFRAITQALLEISNSTAKTDYLRFEKPIVEVNSSINGGQVTFFIESLLCIRDEVLCGVQAHQLSHQIRYDILANNVRIDDARLKVHSMAQPGFFSNVLLLFNYPFVSQASMEADNEYILVEMPQAEGEFQSDFDSLKK